MIHVINTAKFSCWPVCREGCHDVTNDMWGGNFPVSLDKER